MKQLLTLFAFALLSFSANAQLKRDGTPDMRYKANKETYGNSYSAPSYSTPSNSNSSYSTPKQERNYENGGNLRMQDGYMKSNGTYVQPHIKSTPDNNTYNNYNSYRR